MTSIRRQLLVSLFVALTLAGLGAAAGVYLQARREANALCDYHLKQIALALGDHAATAIAVASSDADDAEQETVIQIWDAAGFHLYNSSPGHPPPPQTGPGWTTVTTRHGAWHIFSLHDDERIIQVAQPLAVRSALAVQMAVRTLLPWLGVVLGLAGVIWWVVGRGLQPLMAVAHAVEARTPEALEPLPVTGLPDEPSLPMPRMRCAPRSRPCTCKRRWWPAPATMPNGRAPSTPCCTQCSEPRTWCSNS